MIKKNLIYGLAVLSVFLIGAFVTVNSQGESENIIDKSGTTISESVVSEVESKYVCMINDQLFNKEQIPVEVDGKTYYGCCEMCKAKLNSDPSSRTAVDPVSGQKVDKALSVTGAASDGHVFYFENKNNLEKFRDNTK